MKKRKVFLLGAGAAMDWHKGPSTSKITKLIRESGFKNAEGEYVTEKIFQWLSENGREPNFETILSVIEDFFQFWMRNENDWPNGLNYFINKEDVKWEDFIDLEKNQYLKTSGNKYSIEFPWSLSLTYLADNINSDIHPNAKYFELLLIHLFQLLSSLISEYSFYTDFNQKFYRCKSNSEINSLMQNYIRNESKNNYLRIYSLNYDNILQVLFEKEGIPIIQGFDTNGRNIVCRLDNYGVKPSPNSILFERNKHCVYHLHGNANWIIKEYNDNVIKSYEYRLKGYIDFNENSANLGRNMEQGKPLFLTNIVTGYQKTQRTSLSPLRQMMSSFDMDCQTADEIVIIGYSFGDEHINDIIRQARKENKNLKVKIVNLGFNQKQTTQFLLNFMTDWGKVRDFVFNNESEDEFISEQYNVEIYKKTFKSYLQDRLHLQNK